MAPFLLLLFTSNLEIPSKKSDTIYSINIQLKGLFGNSVYVLIVLGQAANIFTVGGIAFWGNDYLETYYGMDPTLAVISFGTITVATGLIGTFVGAAILDAMLKPSLKDLEQSRISQSELDDFRTIKATQIMLVSAFGALVIACML